MFACLFCFSVSAQETSYLLKADQVFDGRDFHKGWVVEVIGNEIVYAGPERRGTFDETYELKGHTLCLV